MTVEEEEEEEEYKEKEEEEDDNKEQKRDYLSLKFKYFLAFNEQFSSYMICLCVNKYFKMPEYSHLQVLANPMNIVIPINLSFTLRFERK